MPLACRPDPVAQAPVVPASCHSYTCCPCSHALLHHVAFLETWRLGYQMMAAATGLVFRKSLRITKYASLSTLTLSEGAFWP